MKIYIVDEDELYSEILTKKLNDNGFDDVNQVSSPKELTASLAIAPDVVILNHDFESMAGINSISDITANYLDCNIVYIAPLNNIKVLSKAHLVGAKAVYQKGASLAEKLISYLKRIKRETEYEKNNLLSELIASNKKQLVDKQKLSLFIVDDNNFFLHFLESKLKGIGDFDLSLFTEGTEAILNYKEQPDIMILDYHLMNIKGTEVLTVFKEKSPDTKVFMLSSQQNVDIAFSLFEIGLDEYLVKDEELQENLKLAITKYFPSYCLVT